MIEIVSGAQVLFLTAVLLTACAAKLVVREEPAPAGDEWLLKLRRNRRLAVAVALAEGGLGLALLVSAHPAVRIAVAAWFAAATWVVGELLNRRPDAGCGCFGGLSTARVGRRGLLRAAGCTVAAIASLHASGDGLAIAAGAPAMTGLLVATELALLVMLSPELGALLDRYRAIVPCEARPSPLAETYQTLHASSDWREHRSALRSTEPVDVWREGCWRLLAYPARIGDEELEIVFAVSTEQRHRAVRVALVESETEDSGPTPFRPVLA
ncbi:hypothetical protein DPM19_12395 [Actinomadura craniellae]|uniref:Methylamine utilisation protein MauE domain-containing protein n=1 Tax=Actinomadura craniellae TaxID=2231787 RepID=A0A365H6A9_9ACTN|nr:MauE/DoxX family redox-associated membrane protein [Actinomadura craniellae]RAY14568.1 hypothetical protein DPM19_12395 [Actinomadura craniellae]